MAEGQMAAKPEFKTWTEEDVRIHLGLVPFHEYYIKGIRETLGRHDHLGIDQTYADLWRGRGTGRSTYMLCQAAAAVMNNEYVIIEAFPDSHRDRLIRRLHEIVASLGGHEDLIVSSRIRHTPDEEPYRTFIDSTWADKSFENYPFRDPPSPPPWALRRRTRTVEERPFVKVQL